MELIYITPIYKVHKMKYKKMLVVLLALTAVTFTISFAYAGTGSIRIDPPLPYMSESPAEFEIWVQGTTTANDPHILLVIPESCLGCDVEIEWTGGSITITDWDAPTAKKVPPDASHGAGYTVASLKDHLETSEDIWYAFEPILGEPLVPGETYYITITMSCEDPKMLVYIMGKSGCSSKFDMCVPPTIPGFVIPEVPMGTLMALASMIGTVGIYKLRRK
jgi:hypothetical protein